MTNEKNDLPNNTTRLPCRGCTQSCPSYKICQGKPWRMDSLQLQARVQKH